MLRSRLFTYGLRFMFKFNRKFLHYTSSSSSQYFTLIPIVGLHILYHIIDLSLHLYKKYTTKKKYSKYFPLYFNAIEFDSTNKV